MRIISQNDMVDIPYRLCSLEEGENDAGTYTIEAVVFASRVLMGKYETEERAKEILQEIRERYNIGAKFYVMPTE